MVPRGLRRRRRAGWMRVWSPHETRHETDSADARYRARSHDGSRRAFARGDAYRGGVGDAESSVHRLLASLQDLGFVQRIEATKRYTLSADIFDFVHEIAWHFGRNLRLDDQLRAAAVKLGCSVYISMLGRRDTYVVCAAGEEGNTTRLGSHGRAYASSVGKVLVAQLPESEWARYAPGNDEAPATRYTNRDPKKFLAQLREAHRAGFAWNRRESSKDHVSVAAVLREPFIDPPRLAVALLMRHEAFALRDQKELEVELLKLAGELERELGSR